MSITTAPGFARTATPSKSFRQLIQAIGARVGRFMEIQARSAEIERLQAKSDHELARMGLTRERIVAHVFRDRFCF
mgnify:CR=1 FL=1